MEPDFFLKNLNFFFNAHSIAPETPLLLAISGGVDSVVLGRSLMMLGYDVAFAHVNHGLRGLESEEDATFVRGLADELGCLYFEHRLSGLPKSNLQEHARNARYDWLLGIAAQTDRKLTTAHNQDDQLETVLMHLGRGTGLRGMMGMLPINELGVLHPLLHHSKEEILDFANLQKWTWREDASNATGKYLRNRVRQQLIPVAKELFPAFENVMQRNIQHFSTAQAFIAEQIAQLQLISAQTHDGFALDIAKLRNTSFAVFVISEVLNYRELSQIEKMLSAGVGASFPLADGRTVHIERDVWWVLSDSHQVEIEILEIQDLPFRGVYRGGEIRLSIQSRSAINEFEPRKCYLDWDKLQQQLPLRITQWQNGQRMSPLGLKGKSKKISDLLTDQKYPAHQKSFAWVLFDNSGMVVTLENLVSAFEYRVREGTNEVLVLE